MRRDPTITKRRAVILSGRGFVTDTLVATVDALRTDHDEIILAFEGRDLLPRWVHARMLFAERRHVFTTALVPCAGLSRREERCAALVARLGSITTLVVDSPAWLASAKTVGLSARFVAELFSRRRVDVPEPPMRSRALVVTRAQPFHLGHLALIELGLARCDEVVVVIAAAERSHAPRDPFTAGERLSLVRASLEPMLPRVWLAALPSPPLPAMALAQLSFWLPSFERVIAHNPILRAMCEQEGKVTDALSAAVEVQGQRISATMIRARLASEGAGPWLNEYVPYPSAALLRAGALAERCALTVRAKG